MRIVPTSFTAFCNVWNAVRGSEMIDRPRVQMPASYSPFSKVPSGSAVTSPYIRVTLFQLLSAMRLSGSCQHPFRPVDAEYSPLRRLDLFMDKRELLPGATAEGDYTVTAFQFQSNPSKSSVSRDSAQTASGGIRPIMAKISRIWSAALAFVDQKCSGSQRGLKIFL